MRGLQALTDPYRCQSCCGQGVCREACLHSTLAPQGLAQAGSPPARQPAAPPDASGRRPFPQGKAWPIQPPAGGTSKCPQPRLRPALRPPSLSAAGEPPVTGGRETPDRSTPSPARREEIRGSSHSAPPTAQPASPNSAPTWRNAELPPPLPLGQWAGGTGRRPSEPGRCGQNGQSGAAGREVGVTAPRPSGTRPARPWRLRCAAPWRLRGGTVAAARLAGGAALRAGRSGKMAGRVSGGGGEQGRTLPALAASQPPLPPSATSFPATPLRFCSSLGAGVVRWLLAAPLPGWSFSPGGVWGLLRVLWGCGDPTSGVGGPEGAVWPFSLWGRTVGSPRGAVRQRWPLGDVGCGTGLWGSLRSPVRPGWPPSLWVWGRI